MKIRENPPYAPNLMESIRSMGYSFETAIADIIDKSIAAKASYVDIVSLTDSDNPFLTLLDDGVGMSSEELFVAMKYGSTNPKEKREEDDMGRFGLGMKSASLSQCRKLTVVSKKDGNVSGLCWNIDYIINNGNWSIIELEHDDLISVVRFNELNDLNSGTLVIWENFDRISDTSSNLSDTLKTKLYVCIDHLSLIYHRILGRNFKISVNGDPIVPKDPFLENNPATQKKRKQIIKIDGSKISVEPFILPHVNKLKKEDIEKVGGVDSLRSNQGFYIYRNRRLIIWGTWFRMNLKSELSKLARVRVDIPNELDYIWDIDIKKSRAVIPDKIKRNLINAVNQACGISENVHHYRGKKIQDTTFLHYWDVLQRRKNEGIALEINDQHPIISAFSDTLDSTQKKAFFAILSGIEAEIPYDYIYTKISSGNRTIVESTDDENEKEFNRIIDEIDNMSLLGLDKQYLIDTYLSMENIANNKYISQRLKELKN